MILIFVLSVSVLLQFTAAFLALRLIRITGRRRAWLFIAAGIFLMAIRRSITLFHVLTGELLHPLDQAAELVELGTSVLILIGVAWIAPFFLSIKRSEDTLRQSENKYRILIENLPQKIFLKDRNSVYVSCNENYARDLKIRPEEITGKTDYEFFPKELAEKYRTDDKRIMESGNTEDIEERYIQDGQEVWVYTVKTPIRDEKGNSIGVLGIFWDITERKRAEEAYEKLSRQNELILNAAGEGIVGLDLQGNITFINPAAARMVGWEAEELIGKPQHEIMHHSKPNGTYFHREECPIYAAFKDGIVHHVDNEVFWRKDGTSFPVEYISTPIRERGKLSGAVVSFKDITERKQRERELEALTAVSAALRTAASRSEILPVILDQLLDLLKVEGAALAMCDPVSSEIMIELARGSWANVTGLRLQPGEGISGHVIATSQPCLTNDIRSNPLLAIPDLPGDISAVACVPLIAQGQTIGALWIGRKIDIAPDDVRLLTAISDIAANAIQRATLHEQTVRRMQQLATLRAIDRTITSSLDLRVTLNILVEQAIAQLQVDAATVLLLNPYTQTLEYAAGRGFRSRAIQQTRLRLGEGHAGRAALEHRIISVPNVLKTEDACVRAQMLAGEVFIAHHAVPLIAKGQIKGVLEVFHRTPLVPEQEWLDFLEALAIQAAIAIDNAELFNNLQRSNIELAMAYDTTLEGWSHALDLRDRETEGHTQRVAEMTVGVASAMGIGEAEMVHLRRGALLHDIGKMGISDNVLLKPGPLTKEEWDIMRKHPLFAYEMLSSIAFLRPALDIPYCHHERWDGTGYPLGLKGEQIPLSARIFAVVDVWDALRSDRPYRPAWPEEKIREYIREQAGKHFDPKVVEIFFKMV